MGIKKIVFRRTSTKRFRYDKTKPLLDHNINYEKYFKSRGKSDSKRFNALEGLKVEKKKGF